MEETKELSEKEQLIESALKKILEGGDVNFKLAIWDLKMAEEKTIQYFDSNNNPNYKLDLKIVLIRRFLEILSGLGKSKDELIKLLLNRVHFKKIGGEWECVENIEQVMYNGYQGFLTDELPEIWLKSIKYDAISKEFESSESEERNGKSQLDKIKSIIRK
ncbi:hypothetical protein [Algoriphagus limi]|uniref:Uncharacterized protein n=1 Tax=Algoriphagus limi TaxID=2975273 RepID=A0ABT2G0V3_9BACT|nr:hypothetical protein [Algoriphagus limi]MCS5488884.1 hypothetical protein [Algoriphagus limi]